MILASMGVMNFCGVLFHPLRMERRPRGAGSFLLMTQSVACSLVSMRAFGLRADNRNKKVIVAHYRFLCRPMRRRRQIGWLRFTEARAKFLASLFAGYLPDLRVRGFITDKRLLV